MEYKADKEFIPLGGHRHPRKVAFYQEDGEWLAVFPGTPFGADPKVLLAFHPVEGHVSVEVSYLRNLKRITPTKEMLGILDRVGYWDLEVQQGRTMQGKSANDKNGFYTVVGFSESNSFGQPDNRDVVYCRDIESVQYEFEKWMGWHERVGTDPAHAYMRVWKGRQDAEEVLYGDLEPDYELKWDDKSGEIGWRQV